MYERYTEKARRVLFFARYEASVSGTPSIDGRHLLLGLMREDPKVVKLILKSPSPLAAIRKEIELGFHPAEKISTSGPAVRRGSEAGASLRGGGVAATGA